MSGIEQAATAFDQDMGNAPANSEVSNNEVSRVAMEDIFRPRHIEVDDDSPAIAGGDNDVEIIPPKRTPKPQRPARDEAQLAVEGDDPTEDDILYGGDDPEDPDNDDPNADPEDPEDPDNEDPNADQGVVELPEEVLQSKVEVIVDGQPLEVTVAEALKGYQRQEVFHQRLNQVNEAVKEVHNVAQRVVEQRQEAISLIDSLGEQLASIIPEEPNWDELFKADPVKARELQKNYGELTGKLTTLAKQREDLVRKNAADQAEQMKVFISTEREKVDKANPHWSDPKKKAKDLSSMVRTLRSHNFNDEEIRHLYDSRMIAVVLKASKYDRMMAAARPKQQQRGRNPVVPSGTGRTRTVPKVARAQKQLSRSGRVEDAAAVFQQLLTR